MMEIALSYNQLEWLKHQGGREEKDVSADEEGKLFVLMGDGHGGMRREYLPENI